MRRKQKLPPMLLFTCDTELFDWFGWGDWLYVFASLLSFVQAFFIFFPLNDDVNFGFNLLGKNHYIINIFAISISLFSSMLNNNNTVNLIFLIDSLAYFIGYILFLRELEAASNTSSYQRPSQVAVIRYATPLL